MEAHVAGFSSASYAGLANSLKYVPAANNVSHKDRFAKADDHRF